MNTSQKKQHGASAIVGIIILAIFAAGIYIGFQYVPQYIEAGTVDTILSNIEKANMRSHVTSTKAVRDMIDKQLNMNQMDDLSSSFKVSEVGDDYRIEVRYERELNLLYTKKPMIYEKTLTLR
jgi:Domain of unknown function (DUF4845)